MWLKGGYCKKWSQILNTFVYKALPLTGKCIIETELKEDEEPTEPYPSSVSPWSPSRPSVSQAPATGGAPLHNQPHTLTVSDYCTSLREHLSRKKTKCFLSGIAVNFGNTMNLKLAVTQNHP